MCFERNIVLQTPMVLRIRPQFEENRGSRLITYTQASERSLSTWVGDDQGIATVERQFSFLFALFHYLARRGLGQCFCQDFPEIPLSDMSRVASVNAPYDLMLCRFLSVALYVVL